METRVILSWQAKEYDFIPKSPSWYWAVGIVAAGLAAAAFIVGDYLFGIIAIIGGFTVMLVGSAKPKRHTYRLTERGLMIGTRLVAYDEMQKFAVHLEDDPPTLEIETHTLAGTVSAPLGDADYRALQMELKNQNIEEVESLDSFVNKVARGIGL